MTGRLEDFDPDPGSQLDGVAVAGRVELVPGLCACAEMDRGPLAIPQLEMARDEVRVEVGQKDVADPAADPPRGLDIVVDVTLRVDDRRHAAALVGDEIGRVGQAAEVMLFEDHGPAPACPLRRRSARRRHDPDVRSRRVPAVGVGLAGLLVGNGAGDDHVLALPPVHRRGDLVLGG